MIVKLISFLLKILKITRPRIKYIKNVMNFNFDDFFLVIFFFYFSFCYKRTLFVEYCVRYIFFINFYLEGR